jgi:hypothetical protein
VLFGFDLFTDVDFGADLVDFVELGRLLLVLLLLLLLPPPRLPPFAKRSLIPENRNITATSSTNATFLNFFILCLLSIKTFRT